MEADMSGREEFEHLEPAVAESVTERVDDDRYVNRELSWLCFNRRVLQEASDPRVPLFERVRFLAIYSSNLDEFFRVRVASLRSLLRLKSKHHRKLDLDPETLMERIHQTVAEQQEEFGRIYREEIIPELANHGVHLVQPDELSASDRDFLEEWRTDNLYPSVNAAIIRADGGRPFLHNRSLYLVVRLGSRIARHPWGEEEGSEATEGDHIALVEVPTGEHSRFLELPSEEGEHRAMYLDDVIRDGLDRLFPGFDVDGAWSIKLTRDADLNIEDEFSGDLLKKIQKGLHKRETGAPSRFLYDNEMPSGILKRLRKGLDLSKDDLVAGGRYHNFNDLFSFPFPETNDPALVFRPMPPLDHPGLRDEEDLFRAIRRKDVILHFPYQKYDYVIDFLEKAATDPQVTSMAITLYRVAEDSKVARALIHAAEQGKEVTAFVELKARFDEESNIFWAGEMENAGVRVLYSFPGLKVHAKICLVSRIESDQQVEYAYLGTGNFNEKTSRIYADHALLTADTRLTAELTELFSFLRGETRDPEFRHLLVAPFVLRDRLNEMVDREIELARSGKGGSITVKVNSLEDWQMIDRLYEAHDAGVELRLIVRGICCLRSGVEGLSEDLTAISIVDRFLEHARVYVFGNGGDEEWYIGSADWMKRNLSKRVEVVFPLYDDEVREELRTIIELQWADNCRARLLGEECMNRYRTTQGPSIRAQVDTYNWADWLLDRKGEDPTQSTARLDR